MQVTHENTPNPATLKFNFSAKICSGQHDFPNVESTDTSPLAAKVFGFPWVSAVFIGENFVTITKQDWVDWQVLANPLSGLLAEHITSGTAVIVERPKGADTDANINENDSPIVKQIKKVIQDEIRPIVALDGGDVVFSKYENTKLYIQMKGACKGCPSSEATLKDGIEVRMRQAIPEITEVLAV